jgi:hypothetical protein
MLVQRAKLGDLPVSQHATWGMSDQDRFQISIRSLSARNLFEIANSSPFWVLFQLTFLLHPSDAVK